MYELEQNIDVLETLHALRDRLDNIHPDWEEETKRHRQEILDKLKALIEAHGQSSDQREAGHKEE